MRVCELDGTLVIFVALQTGCQEVVEMNGRFAGEGKPDCIDNTRRLIGWRKGDRDGWTTQDVVQLGVLANEGTVVAFE